MKQRSLIRLSAFLLVVIVCLLQIPSAGAYDLPQNIKIGLLYDGAAPASVSLKSDGGLSFGIENSDTVVMMGDLLQTAVTAERSAQHYICLQEAFDSFDAAQKAAWDLSARGISCFPAYKDWKFYVYAGPYQSKDAATAALAAREGFSAVSPHANTYLIKDSAGKAVALFVSTVDSLIVSPKDGVIYLNGQPYRGSMILYTTKDEKTHAVNFVNLEEYLFSVVAKEVSPSWPMEALKAQAVAARTFAMKNLNKYSGKGFHLTNTTADQVYPGISAEHERTTQAVGQTRGQILLYNGQPIEALYSASSGGKTENSQNVWGGVFPYLVSVEDPYEPADKASYYTWEVTLTKADIKTILGNRNIHIGDIVDVKPLSFSPAGRVTKLQFVGTGGTKEYTNDSCRTIFGGKLRSQWYTVKRPDVFTALTESGRADFNFSGAWVMTQNGKEALQQGTNSASILSAGGVSVLSSPDAFVFSGRGYGHGVGMSQWGAYGMAQAGFTYDKILRHYYTGAYLSE